MGCLSEWPHAVGLRWEQYAGGTLAVPDALESSRVMEQDTARHARYHGHSAGRPQRARIAAVSGGDSARSLALAAQGAGLLPFSRYADVAQHAPGVGPRGVPAALVRAVADHPATRYQPSARCGAEAVVGMAAAVFPRRFQLLLVSPQQPQRAPALGRPCQSPLLAVPELRYGPAPGRRRAAAQVSVLAVAAAAGL